MPMRDDGALHLLFQLGRDRYALDAREVIEVLPLQRLKAIPEAPPWVAGLLIRQGQPVPVLDLSQRACGRPARAVCGTRLVVVAYRPQNLAESRSARPLGLLLEHASEVARLQEDSFQSTGLAAGAAFLDGVAPGPVQRISVSGLLPADVQALIYPA